MGTTTTTGDRERGRRGYRFRGRAIGVAALGVAAVIASLAGVLPALGAAQHPPAPLNVQLQDFAARGGADNPQPDGDQQRDGDQQPRLTGPPSAPAGEYVPTKEDQAVADSALVIHRMSFVAPESAQVPPEPALFDDSRPAGTKLTLRVEFDAPAPAKGERLELHLRQPRTPGLTKTPVDTQPVGCTTKGCTYHTDVAIAYDGGWPDTLSAAVVLQRAGGPATGAAKDIVWSLECDANPNTAEPFCTEPTGSYEVSGKIEYDRRELVATPGNDPHPQAPQYEYSGLSTPQEVPAREVLVRMADGCGLYTDTYTDADGNYSVPFLSWCGEKDATVTAYSLSGAGAGKQVALGLHTAASGAETWADLQDDAALYTVISGEVGTFNPEQDAAGPGGHTLNRSFGYHETGTLQEQGKFSRDGEVARAFTLLGNAMTTLDYYRQLVDPSRLPQINIVLTDPFLVDEDNYSFYSQNKTNMIYITPDSEWSFWALAHETSHYFDGGILVEGGLDNYGSWGEPMANVRAGMIIGSSWMAAREGVKAENLDVQGNWDEMASEVLPPAHLSVNSPGQGWAWRILWDLHDSGPQTPEPLDFGFGEFDQWDGGGASTQPSNHLLNAVVLQYLPQHNGAQHPDYQDRGHSGPDVVDMLDGFACLYGLSHLQLETMLHDVMNYDYDFAHCSNPDDLAP
ncbi:MAG: hypothetical protein ACT4NY_29980 [Pseudonocardiales bacterium]